MINNTPEDIILKELNDLKQEKEKEAEKQAKRRKK